MTTRAIAFVLGVFAGCQANAESLGLGDLIELADKSNLGRVEGRLGLQKSESEVTRARSAFLPRLLVESEAGYGSRSEAWTSEASLVLRQNFYDGGRSWSEFRRAAVSRDRARFEEQRARGSLALAVLRAYADSSRLERNRVASRRKLELLEGQFELSRRQYRQGRKTQRDYQLLEAELERSRLELESLDARIFSSYRELEKIVGSADAAFDATKIEMLTAEKILSLKSWSSPVAYDPSTESLELKAQALSVEDRKLALDLARRQYWPVLDLSASASYGSTDFVGPLSEGWSANAGTNLGAALRVTWTLWDWGGVPAQVASAKADALVEERRYEQKKLELVNDYRSLGENLKRQLRVLELQKKIRGLERNSFRNIEKEYREGRSSYLDLITALERDIQAELSFENEAFSYFVSLAEVLELKGNLYEYAKAL